MNNQSDSKKSILLRLLEPSRSSKNLKLSQVPEPEVCLSNFEATGETIFSGCLKNCKIVRGQNEKTLYTLKTIRKYSLLSVESTRKKIQKTILIDHANFLKIHFFLEDSSNFYIFYQYLPGDDLASEIIMEDGLSQEKCQDYFYEICSGLDFLHNKSIILKHFSLENIYFDINHKIKIALELEDKITNQDYIAPEGGRATYPSDIWCLGIMLFEMIHGYCPGDISAISPNLPVFTSSLLSKLLNRHPEKRITAKKALVHSYFNRKLDQSVIIDRIQQRIHNSLKFNQKKKDRKTQSTNYSENISTIEDRYSRSKLC